MERIIIMGAGGHARVVIDTIRILGTYEIEGIVDEYSHVGELVDGVPVIGRDEDLGLFAKGAQAAVVAIGSVGDPSVRIAAAEAALEAGLHLPTLIHPSAVVSPSARFGEGCFVAMGAVVGVSVKAGDFVIINTGAVLDHDCEVGHYVHIAPNATLCGAVSVGDRTHVGTGSSVVQGITIGADTIVGAGSAVVHDIPDQVVAMGVPCHVTSRRTA